MIEIRFHGRGGQGAVVASKLLAITAARSNYFIQAFPAFGAERRVAPVVAFTRMDIFQIYRRTIIYRPDHVLVFDARLLDLVDVTSGLKEKGILLINAIGVPKSITRFSSFRIALVDANRIAIENQLGTAMAPIVNTAMLGAFLRVSGLFDLERLLVSIKESIGDVAGNNMEAAKRGFKEVTFFSCDPTSIREKL